MENNINESKLHSIKETCNILGISRYILTNLIESGELEAINTSRLQNKHYKIKGSTILQFLNK